MAVNPGKILDVATWQPPTRIRKDVSRSGVPIEIIEKVPGVFHERWLNPAGAVIRLPLGNCNARAEGERTPYYGQIQQRKMAAGWIPYGRCVVAMVLSGELSSRNVKNKDLLEGTACTPDPQRPFGPENPCPHCISERDYRAAKHNEREASKAESYKKETERDREQRDDHHKETIAALTEGQSKQADVLLALIEKIGGKDVAAEARRQSRKTNEGDE